MTSAGQKIALVTGANKGLGFETARLLGQAGIHVILTARDEKRGKDAMEKLTKENNKPLFDFVQLDVNEEQSIKSASGHVTKNYGKLDILINNAGIFDIQHDTHPEKVPIASVEKQFKTNFFGTLLVIRYFLPLLRKSDASNGARIINLGTPLSSLQFNGDPTSIYYPYRVLGYNASKLALNLLTVQFAEQFKLDKDNIIINSVAPGFAKTDLVPGGGFITAEEGAKVVVERALTNDTDSGEHFTADKEIVPW